MNAPAPGFFFIMRVLTGMVGIGTPVLLAKALTVPDFALYATLVAASGLALVLSNLGLDRACLRLLPTLSGTARPGPLFGFLARLAAARLFALLLVLAVVATTGIWMPADSVAAPIDLLLWLSITTAASQLSAIFMQGLMLHASYASIVFAAVLLRFGLLLGLYLGYGSLDYRTVIQVFVAFELLSLVVQGVVTSLYAIKSARTQVAHAAIPPMADVFSVARANYLSYLAGIPWMGNSLVLIVGNFSNHDTTAAFAFFQNLVERARQFMPVRMLQTYVEPIWARSHQTHARVQRFQAPLGALQKSQALLLSLALLCVLAVGEPLLRAFTQPLYADQLLLLVFILFQQFFGSVGELLWMGLNATGQVERLTRAFMLISALAFPLMFPAVIYGGVEALVVLTCIPPLVLLLVMRRSGVQFAALSHRTRKGLSFLLAGLLAGGVAHAILVWLRQIDWVVVLGFFSALIVWGVLVASLKPFSRAERLILNRFVRNRKLVRDQGGRN